MFARKVGVKKVKGGEEGGDKGKDKGPKVALLVDPKRAYNIEIRIARMKMSNQHLRSGTRSLAHSLTEKGLFGGRCVNSEREQLSGIRKRVVECSGRCVVLCLFQYRFNFPL
jgi:hypothetical protein